MRGSRKCRGIATFVLVLVVVATVAAGSAGCGDTSDGSSNVIKLTDADNGKSLSAKVGDQIQVILAGNPTTGYAWTVALTDADKAVLQQEGDAVYTGASTGSSVVGGGGTYTFTFKTIATGTAKPAFSYARSFESSPPEKTYTVTVNVK
jgi:inhibitor of cysteine peptidase